MSHDKLEEFEAAVIKRRLQYLKAQGATGKRGTHDLNKDELDSMEDDWEFCSLLADIYSVKEMRSRCHARYRNDETDSDQIYPESIIGYLLSDDDAQPQGERSTSEQ